MTTIKQVAEEAGVSKSTVSRYISKKGYVGDDAREKIKVIGLWLVLFQIMIR